VTKMPECAICGKETEQLHECLECGRLVCELCYVEAVDMCTDCEKTSGKQKKTLISFRHDRWVRNNIDLHALSERVQIFFSGNQFETKLEPTKMATKSRRQLEKSLTYNSELA